MKHVLIFFLFLFTLSTAQAQAPNAIPYQAAARNSSGAILATTNISVRFTIRDITATGSIVYRETHAVTTSSQGLFSVNVGQGIPVSGSFLGINWGVNHKFLQVELDPTGGSSYIDMGTQQMLSVPYALFSGATRPTVSSVGDTMYFGGGVYYIIPGISAANCTVSAGAITSATATCSGSNILLSSTVTGGVWSSSNTSVAPIVGGNILVGFSAGTTTVSYTVTHACGSATATAVVTVNPLPSAGILSGATAVCEGQTITLSSTTTGGVWTSSNMAVGTVSSLGVVSGLSAGATTISYTVSNSCGSVSATRPVTVNPLPDAGTLSGVLEVCVGDTTALSTTGTGGTWSSGAAIVATISPTGVVTGVAAGTAAITYKVVNSCGTTNGVTVVTVNPLANAGTISGADTIMIGGAITLSDTVSGGTWSSSNTAVATVGTTGTTNGVSVGTATISYSVTNTCGTSVATKAIYVRPLAIGDSFGGGIIAYILQPFDPGYSATGMRGLIAAPSDLGTAGWGCHGTFVGGTSNEVGAGAANTENILSVCPTASIAARLCANLVLGGYDDWFLPSRAEMSKLYENRLIIGGFASDYYWTSSEASSSGHSAMRFGFSSSDVGFSSHSKSYLLGVRAIRYFSLTCPESAGVISGLSSVCVGSTTTLGNAVSGGTWSSSTSSVATVNASGVVTGVAAGTATITYTITDTCGSATTTRVVTVNPLPTVAAITGADSVAIGSTISLSNTTIGGTWSSSNTAIATVGVGGVVSGIALGTTTISYAVSNTCGTSVVTKVVTVRALAVGDSYGGGIIAYILQPGDPGYVAGQFRAIIAAPTDQGVIQWGCYGTLLGSTSQTLGSGAANTVSVSASCGAGTAARLCADLVLGGYNDWYLPSKNELDKLRANRSLIGGFALGSYWSSSESSVNNALLVNFNTGNALSVAKNEAFNVRAIRSIDCPELPGSITGTASVCVGSATTFSTATSGGTWSSSATGIATVNASGVVTGVAAGTATISYTVTESCGSASATRVVSVNTTPSVATITGTAIVTAGSTTTFSTATSGGTWSSSATGIATVNASGVVTGVTAGTVTISYTVTNGCGSTAATIAVTVDPASLTIGATYGGGVIAYILLPGDPGYIAGEQHGLIAAPTDQGTATWGCSTTSVGGTFTTYGTGATNTAIVSAACGAGTAARLCADLVLNGYTDWYLPSKDELQKLYINRTSIGGFSNVFYLSSSEFDSTTSWFIFFGSSGLTNANAKSSTDYVRAVRTF